MPFSAWNDPKLWRQRADEARALAEVMYDPGARENMLKVAAAYDEMAMRAEAHPLIKSPPKKP